MSGQFERTIGRHEYRDQQAFLAASSVAPNVFQVGIGSVRVTVFSQQTRALRLADAIATVNFTGTAKPSIAVVGGGIAGCTVSAALSELLPSAAITLYSDTEPLSQLSQSYRYIHPHVLEWPVRGWNRASSGLPVLTWSAGAARDVVAEALGPAFDFYLAGLDGSPKIVVDTKRVRDVSSRLDQRESRANGDKIVLDNEHVHDVVILACGYGVDGAPRKKLKLEKNVELIRKPYWSADEIRHDVKNFDRVRIVGGGDGAIADLLEIVYGTHVVRDVTEVQALTTSRDIQAHARTIAGGTASSTLGGVDQLQRSIHDDPDFGPVSELLKELEKKHKKNNVVIHLGKDFGSTASPLNKFLLAASVELGHSQFAKQAEHVGTDPKFNYKAGHTALIWRTGPSRPDYPRIDGRTLPSLIGKPRENPILRHFPRVEDWCLADTLPRPPS